MAETLPWASGKRKPIPGVKPAVRRRRRRSKTSVRTVLWGIVSLALAITFLIVQGILLAIFLGLTMAVTALSAVADAKADPDELPARKPTAPRSATSPGKPQNTAATAGSNVKCTKTGRPTDVCPCPEKHVITSRGAARFKLAVGAPIPGTTGVKRAPKVKTVKESKVPTTNKARPIRQAPGERMRRVQ